MEEMRRDDGSFIVISDFHSNRWPLDEKIMQHYFSEYAVTYILGDATDRGSFGHNNGDGGLQLLIDIMELVKKFPGKIVYLPGNHDEMLYYCAAYPETRTGNLMRESIFENHGSSTIRDLETLRRENPAKFRELIEWLGSLPIQKIHVYGGQKYALAHAFFNESIYDKNPNFSLRDLYESQGEYYDSRSPYSQILWFRKGEDIYVPENVPTDCIEIIGHTPIQYRENRNLDLANAEGRLTKVICVDNGIAYQSRSNEMLKYVGGQEMAVATERGIHEPNPQRKEVTYSKEEHDLFIEAVITTMRKHGASQVEKAITDWIFTERADWYKTFSAPQRSYIARIEIEKIQKIIRDYSPQHERRISAITQNFISAVTLGQTIKGKHQVEAPQEPKKEERTSIINQKALRILDRIATREEQEIIVTHEGKEYTLRDYVIEVLFLRYTAKGLEVMHDNKYVDFESYIKGIIRQKKTEERRAAERRIRIERENKDRITRKLVQILLENTSEEEQNIAVPVQGKECRLKDYVLEIIPSLYKIIENDGELIASIDGEWINVEEYINNILLGYRRQQEIQAILSSKHFTDEQKQAMIDDMDEPSMSSGSNKKR